MLPYPSHSSDPPKRPSHSRLRDRKHALPDNAIATGNRPTTGVGESATPPPPPPLTCVLCRTGPTTPCEWCGDCYPDAVSLSEMIAAAEADFLAGGEVTMKITDAMADAALVQFFGPSWTALQTPRTLELGRADMRTALSAALVVSPLGELVAALEGLLAFDCTAYSKGSDRARALLCAKKAGWAALAKVKGETP